MSALHVLKVSSEKLLIIDTKGCKEPAADLLLICS